jgi:uncharacterized protein (TIGR02996 family)
MWWHMSHLLLVGDDGKELTVQLDGGPVFIGRQYPIGRTENTLSRRHAVVRREGERFVVEDLGSTSGTYVNDVNIHGARPLVNSDLIRCGQLLLRFVEESVPPSRAALLEAVHAAPDDDAPRLVYADVLAEAGDPRGEFIQLDLAVARAARGTPERRALVRRRAELAVANPSWYPVASPRFERGFVERFEILAVDDRPEHASGQLVLPRDVIVRGHHVPAFTRLLESTAAATIEALELRLGALGPSFDVLLATLAAAPPPRLRALRLRGNPSEEGLRRLTETTFFARIDALTLDTPSAISLPARLLVGKKRVALRGKLTPSSVATALRVAPSITELALAPALAEELGLDVPAYVVPDDHPNAVAFATDDADDARTLLEVRLARKA